MYCYSIMYTESNKNAGNPIAQTVSNNSTCSVYQGALCSSAVRVLERHSLCFQFDFKGERTGHAGFRLSGFLVIKADANIAAIRVDVHLLLYLQLSGLLPGQLITLFSYKQKAFNTMRFAIVLFSVYTLPIFSSTVCFSLSYCSLSM